MRNKSKRCESCAARGKSVPVCPNNGVYCWSCIQYEAIVYAWKTTDGLRENFTRKPLQTANQPHDETTE